jgi:hypothetical protein
VLMDQRESKVDVVHPSRDALNATHKEPQSRI